MTTLAFQQRTLAQAEEKAARIFKRAGLDVVWKTCSSRSTKHVDPDVLVRALASKARQALCSRRTAGLHPAGQVGAPASTWSVTGLWPVRVAHPSCGTHRGQVEARRLSDVFGEAFLSAEGTGCYSDVFYDRAVEPYMPIGMSASADILGNVMAHELGHLLLGSNSHTATGIMRARWQGEELRRAGERQPVVQRGTSRTHAR